MDKKVIENLSRVVKIIDGKVKMSTEACSGVEYAFYFRGKDGLTKRGYITKNVVYFNVSLQTGIYKATFFYKKGEEKISISHDFYLNENHELCSLEGIVVDEGDSWRIDYYNIQSKITFVVFNALGSTKDSKPFGLEFLIKRGFNVIHCLQNKDQYQSLSFEKVRETCSPLVADKTVYLYGASLGGYCTLYYAGAVNGIAIAAAPKNTAHPILIERAKGKTRYKAKDFRHKNIWENPISNHKPYIIYDPYVETDKFFINNYINVAYPDYYDLPCEFAGHRVLMHLNSTKQLSQIIDNIVAGLPVVIDQSLSSCHTDFGRASKAFKDGDLVSASCILENLLDSPSKVERKVLEQAVLLDEEIKKLQECNS